MSRARRRPRHEINWKNVKPQKVRKSTRERLLEAAGIDPLVKDQNDTAKRMISDVEALLGAYPDLVKRHESGPRAAQFRNEVRALSTQAARLLKLLDALSPEVREDLVHDRECPEINLDLVHAQVSRLCTQGQFIQGSYAKESRGKPYQVAKRMLIMGLCRTFLKYHCQEPEAAEDAKKEFVRVALKGKNISCREADLRRWLSKLPLNHPDWPLDLDG